MRSPRLPLATTISKDTGRLLVGVDPLLTTLAFVGLFSSPVSWSVQLISPTLSARPPFWQVDALRDFVAAWTPAFCGHTLTRFAHNID